MKISAQDWLDRARALGTPLTDDNTATFVWHGEDPPILRGDWNDWDEGSPLPWQQAKSDRGKPVVGPVWTATMELAADAYMEYGFGADKDRSDDPFNPRRVANGMGQFNHCFYMPQGGPTPLALRQRGLPKGEIIRLRPAYPDGGGRPAAPAHPLSATGGWSCAVGAGLRRPGLSAPRQPGHRGG